MKQEHLTPDGWKPCTASSKECKYENRRIANSSAFIDSAVEEVAEGKPNAIKNFFNTLFGTTPNKKPEHSTQKELHQTAPSQKPAPSEPVLNEVMLGEDGQYEVSCIDPWEKRVLTHKFGDLIKDQATAERLHNADVDKQYQLGECGVLAGELWNRNEHVKEYYMFKTKTDPTFGTHHFVQLNDGTYADSMGVWTEEAFFSYWKSIDPTIEKSLFDAEGVPESRKPDFPISNPELFNTISELIDKHMNG